MPLIATIQSIVDERVTLEFEDGQILTVPATAIGGSPVEGARVALAVFPLGGEDAGRSQLARDLLNELLSA